MHFKLGAPGGQIKIDRILHINYTVRVAHRYSGKLELRTLCLNRLVQHRLGVNRYRNLCSG
ncbi:hypothetical protein D3C76_1577450 [compost metagenome]